MSDTEDLGDELFEMLNDLESEPVKPEVIPVAATPPAVVQTVVIAQDTPDPDAAPVPTLSNKYLGRVDDVAEEILQACRSDRQEAQETITLLRDQIDTSLSAGRSPERIYFESLVKAIEVKANINTNAVKAMEMTAKMLAALKPSMAPQTTINNQNAIASTDADLDKLLSEPLRPTDEY